MVSEQLIRKLQQSSKQSSENCWLSKSVQLSYLNHGLVHTMVNTKHMVGVYGKHQAHA